MKKFFPALAVALSLFALTAASASATPPTIVSPQVSGRTGANGIINVHYTLPDAPTYNVSVIFTRQSVGQPQTTFSVTGGGTEEDLTFSAQNPEANPKIVNSSGPIVDGTYMVTVGYFSTVQNEYVAWEHAGVIVDSTTHAASLISPATGSAAKDFPVEFTLPEDQAPGTLKLAFTGAGACTLTLTDQPKYDQITFGVNPASPASSPFVASVASGCTLPDGVYSVALTYGDVWGNPVATTISSNVTLDTATQAPSLVSPASGDIFLNRVAVHYFLPEDGLSGSPQLVFTGAVTRTITFGGEDYGNFAVTFDPDMPESAEGVLDGAAIPDGLYSVTLKYQDAAGNPAASSAAATNVRVGPVPTPPDTQSPQKPIGLVASAVTKTSATLSWTAATDNVGVAGYHAYKDGVFFASPADPSAQVVLECGKTSHFSVSALDAAGNESPQSTVLDVTGAACDVPPASGGGGGGGGGGTVTPPAKQCFAPIKSKTVSGTFKKGKKKVKYSLALSGKIAADGQSIKISATKKNVAFYFKVDGKSFTTSSITVSNSSSVVTLIYKPTIGTNKTIKIKLTLVAC